MTEMVVDHSVREDWAMHLPLLLHALFLGEFTVLCYPYDPQVIPWYVPIYPEPLLAAGRSPPNNMVGSTFKDYGWVQIWKW